MKPWAVTVRVYFWSVRWKQLLMVCFWNRLKKKKAFVTLLGAYQIPGTVNLSQKETISGTATTIVVATWCDLLYTLQLFSKTQLLHSGQISYWDRSVITIPVPVSLSLWSWYHPLQFPPGCAVVLVGKGTSKGFYLTLPTLIALTP